RDSALPGRSKRSPRYQPDGSRSSRIRATCCSISPHGAIRVPLDVVPDVELVADHRLVRGATVAVRADADGRLHDAAFDRRIAAGAVLLKQVADAPVVEEDRGSAPQADPQEGKEADEDAAGPAEVSSDPHGNIVTDVGVARQTGPIQDEQGSSSLLSLPFLRCLSDRQQAPRACPLCRGATFFFLGCMLPK